MILKASITTNSHPHPSSGDDSASPCTSRIAPTSVGTSVIGEYGRSATRSQRGRSTAKNHDRHTNASIVSPMSATPMMPNCRNTSSHMLCACMTVSPWSTIHPSKCGSVGTHGVEKPQPCHGCSIARSHTAPQIVSRPVRSDDRPSAAKIRSRSTHSVVRPPRATTAYAM